MSPDPAVVQDPLEMSVDPIPRPTQYFAPVRLSHAAECIQNSTKGKCPFHQESLQILAQSRFLITGEDHGTPEEAFATAVQFL
jgi:hypothetical protein